MGVLSNLSLSLSLWSVTAMDRTARSFCRSRACFSYCIHVQTYSHTNKHKYSSTQRHKDIPDLYMRYILQLQAMTEGAAQAWLNAFQRRNSLAGTLQARMVGCERH